MYNYYQEIFSSDPSPRSNSMFLDQTKQTAPNSCKSGPIMENDVKATAKTFSHLRFRYQRGPQLDTGELLHSEMCPSKCCRRKLAIWFDFTHLSPTVRGLTRARLDLEAQFPAYVCTLTSYLHLPIFLQIVNVLDRNFKGKTFESNTLAKSNVIIPQTMTDVTSIAIAHAQKVACDLSIGIFAFDLYPFKGQIKVMHNSIVIPRER